MSQISMNQYSQATNQQNASQFPEEWEWEGEHLVLAYNPYDPARSQLRPDYSRLVGERGVCQPVMFLNRTNGEEIRKFVVLPKSRLRPNPDLWFRTSTTDAFGSTTPIWIRALWIGEHWSFTRLNPGTATWTRL